MIKANECKCVDCGGQAVAFFPVIDPDIPSHPYCRSCLNKRKLALAAVLFGDDDERMRTAKEIINSKNGEYDQ